MRSRTRAADGNAFAAKIVRLFYLGTRVQPEVELLMKISDSDELSATEPGVDEMTWTNDRSVYFARNQRRHSQGIARHKDKLRLQAVLFEKAAVLRHPNMGCTFTGDAGGQV